LISLRSQIAPRKPDPRPRFQVSRFFHRWTALDQGRRNGAVERDLSRRPGDHAFVHDFAGQDSDADAARRTELVLAWPRLVVSESENVGSHSRNKPT
jgi:hypothetical protein